MNKRFLHAFTEHKRKIQLKVIALAEQLHSKCLCAFYNICNQKYSVIVTYRKLSFCIRVSPRVLGIPHSLSQIQTVRLS